MSLASWSLSPNPPASRSHRSLASKGGTLVGRWGLVCSAHIVAIALAAAVVSQLAPGSVVVASRAMSVHALSMALLVWLPGLSFSVAPSMFSGASSIGTLRARWVSLGLYVVGSVLLIGSEVVARSPHGLRFYLRYFEAGYRFAIVQSWGLALVALALATNGWLWASLAKRHRDSSPPSAFLALLGMTGIVQVMLAPVAVAQPILMSYERWRGLGVFLPQLGGDPTLMPGLFWLYVQPLLLVAVVPVLGLVEELLVRSTPDARGPRCMSVTQGVAICTLVLFSWGSRAEVVLSPSARGFFAFVGLFTLLLLGRPLVLACVGLYRVQNRSWSIAIASLTAAVLAIGCVSLLPFMLPAASMQWSGTPLASVQIHLLALGVTLLPAALGLRMLKASSELPASHAEARTRLASNPLEQAGGSLPQAHSA